MGNTHIQRIGWDDYRAIKRMNPSTLAHGKKSMRQLKAVIDGGFYEETNAMRLGTGIHALTLEPEDFEATFAVVPDFHLDPQNKTGKGERSESKATSYYKDRVMEFEIANRGKSIIPGTEYRKALRACEAIAEHPTARRLVKLGQKEQTVFGVIEGVDFKGRMDLVDIEIMGCITDVKTTASCDPKLFASVCARLFYILKMSIYRELVRQVTGETLDVKVIAQETSGAHDTVVYDVDPDDLDREFEEVKRILGKYQEAKAKDCWPGIDGGAASLPLRMPSWSVKSEDEEAFDWEQENE